MSLETIAKGFHSPYSYLIPVISALITILGIIKTILSVKKISEYGILGAIVSGTGFFGALAVFTSSSSHIGNVLYVGVALWIIGISLVVGRRIN